MAKKPNHSHPVVLALTIAAVIFSFVALVLTISSIVQKDEPISETTDFVQTTSVIPPMDVVKVCSPFKGVFNVFDEGRENRSDLNWKSQNEQFYQVDPSCDFNAFDYASDLILFERVIEELNGPTTIELDGWFYFEDEEELSLGLISPLYPAGNNEIIFKGNLDTDLTKYWALPGPSQVGLDTIAFDECLARTGFEEFCFEENKAELLKLSGTGFGFEPNSAGKITAVSPMKVGFEDMFFYGGNTPLRMRNDIEGYVSNSIFLKQNDTAITFKGNSSPNFHIVNNVFSAFENYAVHFEDLADIGMVQNNVFINPFYPLDNRFSECDENVLLASNLTDMTDTLIDEIQYNSQYNYNGDISDFLVHGLSDSEIIIDCDSVNPENNFINIDPKLNTWLALSDRIADNPNNPVVYYQVHDIDSAFFPNIGDDIYKPLTNSPLINAGNPASHMNDADGSRNDIGIWGGNFDTSFCHDLDCAIAVLKGEDPGNVNPGPITTGSCQVESMAYYDENDSMRFIFDDNTTVTLDLQTNAVSQKANIFTEEPFVSYRSALESGENASYSSAEINAISEVNNFEFENVVFDEDLIVTKDDEGDYSTSKLSDFGCVDCVVQTHAIYVDEFGIETQFITLDNGEWYIFSPFNGLLETEISDHYLVSNGGPCDNLNSCQIDARTLKGNTEYIVKGNVLWTYEHNDLYQLDDATLVSSSSILNSDSPFRSIGSACGEEIIIEPTGTIDPGPAGNTSSGNSSGGGGGGGNSSNNNNNTTQRFSDVPRTNVFYQNIESLAADGVVNGYDDGRFGVDDFVTRGQTSKFIVNGFNLSADISSCEDFSDMVAGQTFYTEVKTLKCLGIVDGYAVDGSYRPDENLTRGQAMKIVVNSARVAKGDPSYLQFDPTTEAVFPDVPQENVFFEFVMPAYENGIVGGYSSGLFGVDDNVTRGQLSKIIDNTRKEL